MKKKKIMLIVNPCAGRKMGQKISDRVVEWFHEGGADCELFITGKRGDGTEFVLIDGGSFDIIACMGGDGTLNEVVNGVLKSGLDTPLGYIPAGSTNDFANSVNISMDPQQAVKDIIACHTETIDAGRLDEKYFSYVASFGAFTKASYNTPQSMKNVIGRLSYFIEGAMDLSDIHSQHKVVKANGETFEGDYIFGAISNSMTIGGVVKYNDSEVDISDEKLEMLLIKKPERISDLCSLIHSIAHKEYKGNPYIDFCRSDEFVVKSDSATDWSLDGELGKGKKNSTISCVKNKINFIRHIK